jgi:hypothetical protein
MDPPEGIKTKKKRSTTSTRDDSVAIAPGAYFTSDDNDIDGSGDVEDQRFPHFKDQTRPSHDMNVMATKKHEPPGKDSHELSMLDPTESSPTNTPTPLSGPQFKDQVVSQPTNPLISGPQFKDQVVLRERPATRTSSTAEAEQDLSTNEPQSNVSVPDNNGDASSSLEEQSQQEVLVNARLLEETSFFPFTLARATPVREINKRRIILFSSLGIIILMAVVIPIILVALNKETFETLPELSERNSEGPTPFPFPTQSPTSAPTDLELEWIELGGPLNPYCSEDQGGNSVSISRNGLSVAVGAPGRLHMFVKGTVRVYTYKVSGWHLVAKIESFLGIDANGNSIALDDTGSVVAIGAPFVSEDYNEYESVPPWNSSLPLEIINGSVRVFHINKTVPHRQDEISHQQVGSDIFGPEEGSEFGWSVDISSSGDIVAIGCRAKCYVKVMRFSQSVQDWQEFGQPIDCSGVYDDSFGTSVRLSSNGTVLAVGAPIVLSDEDAKFVDEGDAVDDDLLTGRVRVFRHNGSSWTMMGNVITGEAKGDGFGSSIALSDDGTVLASCSPFNDAGEGPITAGDTFDDPSRGSCRVFRYNATQEVWVQLGLDIDGEELYDKFGTSVAMDSVGDVVAIGAEGSNDNGDDSGHVRVFQFDEFENTWIQIGHDIPGPFRKSAFGRSVALSADGDIVTVGSPNDLTISSYMSGSARVYETGIAVNGGDIPVTMVLHFDELYRIGWSVERLDVEQEETYTVISVPVGIFPAEIDPDSLEMTNFSLPEGGVFKFVVFDESENGICCDLDADSDNEYWYEINLPVENGDNDFTVAASGNFTSHTTHTFWTGSKKNFLSGVTNVTLVIDFDDFPEEFHWVLVQSDLEMDHNTNKLKVRRNVLAFGPERHYGSHLAQGQVIEVIDVSPATMDSTLKLIITDDGRDGLCCEFGEGRFRLYNGTFIENYDENILVSSTAEGKRREVHAFQLFDDI